MLGHKARNTLFEKWWADKCKREDIEFAEDSIVKKLCRSAYHKGYKQGDEDTF